ncbi:hypothetical protein BGZ49_007387 [Haplosporangium sp. Z 27]|nr:hypothetical protein BGZ49_007387 [Haplosporangium sp. Z 27]
MPEYITLQLQNISCGGRHDRTMVRFKLQNTSQNTPTAKNLDDHTQHIFTFHPTVHNMAFDTIKIDLFDIKSFGTSHHTSRAYLQLRDLQKLVGSKYDDNIEPSSTNEREYSGINTFSQEHDDVFEINLPLFKPGSYSKLESSLHRNSVIDLVAEVEAEPSSPDTQQSVDSSNVTKIDMRDIEVGDITLKATLHFKTQLISTSPDSSRHSKESGRSSSSSGSSSSRSSTSATLTSSDESPMTGAYHSNQSLASIASTDSSTLGDRHVGFSQSLSNSSLIPSPTPDPVSKSTYEFQRQDILRAYPVDRLTSIRSSTSTPPLSPLSPPIQRSSEFLSVTSSRVGSTGGVPPLRRLSSWYEWNYVEGFVDENADDPPEDILACLNGGHNRTIKDLMKEERERGIELMADIVANGDQSKKDQFLNESSIEAKQSSPKSVRGFLNLFSKQTRSAFKDIQLIYSSFFKHGWNLSRSEFMRGFHVVEQYYAQHPTPKSNIAFEDIESLERARHFVRLAMAAYGSLSWVYFGYSIKVAPLNFIRFNSDRKNVMDYFKLKKEDMIVWHFDKRTALVPSYYIIRDPKYNALCIVLRGTFNITDAMTDLVCEHYPYKGGLVHKGIMDTARFVLERSGKDIEEALEKFNLTKLYCIGHSLGAGSASLLCALLQDHFADYVVPTPNSPSGFEKLEIKAYLFAPPPVCSANLAAEWEDSQIGFVNENDFVCRLSYGSALDLKELIKLGAFESVNPNYVGLSPKEKSKRIMSVMEKAVESLSAVNDIPRFVQSAKLIYLYKAQESDPPVEFSKQNNGTASGKLNNAEESTSPSTTTGPSPTETPNINARSSSLPKGTTVQKQTSDENIRENKKRQTKSFPPEFGTPIRIDGDSNARSLVVQAILDETNAKEQQKQSGSLSRKNSASAACESEKVEEKPKKGSSKNKEIRIVYSDREHFTSIPLRKNWLWHHFPQQYDSKLERALAWVKAQQQKQAMQVREE